MIRIAVVLVFTSAIAAQDGLLPGFTRSPWFGEQIRVITPADGVRCVLNAPRALREAAPLRVVLFATPNGNTLEQTLGCRAAPGLDWHYDIQHVAAQVRRLREVAPDEDIVLACVQAEGLSWPAWRAGRGGGGAGVRAIVKGVLDALPAGDVCLALTAHSGGGSFLWGYLEDGDAIPDEVERIAFLDANYSYSDEKGHGTQLLAWLRRSATHRLIVLAYDDREVEFQGRKVVGPDGGTFRASERMLAALGAEVEFDESRSGDLMRQSGLEGRVTVLRHLNPANRILHTTLVGDMNGLLWTLTLGGAHAADWGAFGGPRAYQAWIQPLPGIGIQAADVEPRPLPERPADAPGGHELVASVAELGLAAREERLLTAIEAGNVPDFLRRFVVVACEADDADGNRHTVRYRVAPDYLAVGSDQDFVRVPFTPRAAQRVADRFGFALPTSRMVTQIHAQAAVRLEPIPLGEPRQAIATFLDHDARIEALRSGHSLGQLVDGIKKDLVVTQRLDSAPGKVAIFGWFHPNGEPIQPLYTGHIATYVDYSHGVRLVAREVEVDGRTLALGDVLADPLLHSLLSAEGPLPRSCQRYRAWD